MVKENVILKSAKFIILDLFLDIFKWPVWWYSTGLGQALNRMYSTIAEGNQELALSVWIKNIFKPMYGQNDWRGRLISFFMRLIQIVFRSIVFLFWILFSLAVFLFWLILPIGLIFLALYNLKIFSV